MRVIIAGSRGICSCKLVFPLIDKSRFEITEVVSGTAHGADMVGEEWATLHNIPIKYFPASWMQYGKQAGVFRNKDMAEYADAAIVLWDGTSSGAKHMNWIMQQYGKPVELHIIPLQTGNNSVLSKNPNDHG